MRSLQTLNSIEEIVKSESFPQLIYNQTQLIRLRENQPQLILQYFLAILQNPSKQIEKHQVFVATQFRNWLSYSSSNRSQTFTFMIIHQNSIPFTKRMVQILEKGNESEAKKEIGKKMSEVIGWTVRLHEDNFKLVVKRIWELVKSKDRQKNITGYLLLQLLVPRCEKIWHKFSQSLSFFFIQGLISRDSKKIISVFKTIIVFFELIQEKERMKYQKIIPAIDFGIISLIRGGKKETAILILSELMNVGYKLFRDKFLQIYRLIHKIFQMNANSRGIQRIAIQILLDYCQKCSMLFLEMPFIRKNFIQKIIMVSLDLPQHLPQQWNLILTNDTIGKQMFSNTFFGLKSIKILSKSLNCFDVQQSVLVEIQGLLIQEEEKCKFGGILLYSHIFQVLQGELNIKSIYSTINLLLYQQSCLLRFVGCYFLSFILNYGKFQLLLSFRELIFNKVIDLLNDPFTRVAVQATNCLRIFVERQTMTPLHVNVLTNHLIFNLRTGTQIIKKNCLMVFEVLTEKQQKYNVFSEEIIKSLLYQLESSKSQDKLENKILILNILMAIGEVHKNIFSLEEITNISIEEMVTKELNLANIYLIFKLKDKHKNKTLKMLPIIIPLLFEYIDKLLDEEETFYPDETKQTKIEQAILYLFNFQAQCKQNYFKETAGILQKIIHKIRSNQTKEKACIHLVYLVLDEQWSTTLSMINSSINIFIRAIEKENCPEMVMIELRSIKRITKIKIIYEMSEYQIRELIDTLVEILVESIYAESRLMSYQHSQTVFLFQEAQNRLKAQRTYEEDIQVLIQEIIQKLYKGNMSIFLTTYIQENLFKKVLKTKKNSAFSFVIHLIKDFTHYFEFESIQQNWFQFIIIILDLSFEESVQIKLLVYENFQYLISKIPSIAINKYHVERWLFSLLQSVGFPEKQFDESLSKVQEYCVVAIGKVLKYHKQFIHVAHFIRYWLLFLPLLQVKEDEALEQNELLMEVVESHPKVILGDSEEENIVGFGLLLSAYGRILSRKEMHNETMKERILNQIINFEQNKWIFIRKRPQICESLKIEEKLAIIQQLYH